MFKSNNALYLDHCHHCGVDEPEMIMVSSFGTNNHRHDAPREWSIHHCASCGGAVLTGSVAGSGEISEIHPAAIKASHFVQPQDGLAGLTAEENRHSKAVGDTDAHCSGVVSLGMHH